MEMKGINNIRIDDRLIHGELATCGVINWE